MSRAFHNGEQYCTKCGEELDVWKRPSYAYEDEDMVFMRCPKKKWWNSGHNELFLRTEASNTVLNYDPFTGERIKRDERAK